MDFNDMSRKQLQSLCKKHKILANGTNEDMKSALTSLLKEEQNPITTSSGETEMVGENGVRKGKKVTFCLESEKTDLGENPDPKMEKDFRRRSILKPQQEELNPIAIRTTRSRGKSLPEQIPVIDLTSPPVQKKKPRKAIVETVSEEVQVDDLVAVTEIPVVRSLRSREVSTDEIVVPSKKKEVNPRKTRRGVVEEPKVVHEVEDVPVVKPKSSEKRATEKGDEGTVVLAPANTPRRTRRNASTSGKEEAISQEPKVINKVPDSKPKISTKRATEQDDQGTVALEPANAPRRTRRSASTSEKEEANSQEQKVINEVRDAPDSKPKRSGKRTTEQEDDETVALEPTNAPRRTRRNASTFGKEEANSEEPMVINEVGDVPDSKPKRSGKTSTGQEDKVDVALVTEIAPRRSRRNAYTSEKEEANSEEPMVTNEAGEVPDLKPKRSGKKSTGQQDKVTLALEPESAPRRSKRNDSAYEKEQADSAKEIKNEPKRQVVPRQSQRNATELETTAPKPETRGFIQKERVLCEEPRRWTRKSRAVVTEDETTAMEDDSKTVSKVQDPPKVIATRASKRKSIAPTELVVYTGNGLGTNKRRKLAEKSLSKEVVSVPEASKLEEHPSRRSTRRASLDNILPLADKERTTDGPKERNEALDGKSLLIDKPITLANVAESYEERRKNTKSQKRRRVTIVENEALQTQNATLLVQEPSRRSRRNDSRSDLVMVTTTITGSAEMVQKEKLEENVDTPQIEIEVLDKKIRAGGDSVEPKPLEKKHSSKGRRGKTVKKHGEKKLEDQVAVEEVSTHEEAIQGDQEVSLVKDGETSQFPDHREAEQLEPLGKEACSVVPPVVSHADILPSTLKSDHTDLFANKEVSASEETDSVVDYVNVKEVMVHGRQNEETILKAQEVPLVSDGEARLLDCCDTGDEPEHLNKEASTVVSTVLISPVDNVSSILQSDHADSVANRGFSTIENISSSPMIVEEVNDQNCSDGKGAMVEPSDADGSVKTLWVNEETDVVNNTQPMADGTECQESKEYMSNGGADQSKSDEIFETTPSSEAFTGETSNLDLSKIDQANSTHPSSTGHCGAEEQLVHLGTEASVMVSTGVISQADDLSIILQSAHTDNVANKKIPTSENTSSSHVAVEEVKDQNCFVAKGDGTEYLESKEYTADGMTDSGADQFKFGNIVETVPTSQPFAVETSNLDPNETVQADCSHLASIEFPNCFSPRAVEDAFGHSTLKRTVQLTHGNDKIGHLEELEFKDSEASEVKLWEDTEESIIDVRKEDDEQEWKEELDVEFSGEVNVKQWNVNSEHGHFGENVDVLTNRPLELDYKVSCDALAYSVSNKEEAIGGAQELPLVSGVGSSSLLNHNELEEDAIHGAQELPLVIGVPKHSEEGEQSKPQEEESSADASKEISSGDSTPKDGGAAVEEVMVHEIVEKETILGIKELQSTSDGGTTHVVVDLSNAEEQSKPVEKKFSDMAYNEVIGDDDSIPQSGYSADYAASEEFLITENTSPKDCSVDVKDVKDLDRSDGKKGQVELSVADGSMEPLCLHEEIFDITKTQTLTEETKYQESHELVDESMTNAAGSQLKIEHYFQVSPTSESVADGTYSIEPNEIDQTDSLSAIDNRHLPSTGFYHRVSTKVLEDKSVETDSTSKEPTVQYIRGNDECIHVEETVDVSTRQTSELGFEVVSETSEAKWEESPGGNISAIRKELCEQECKKECDVGVSVEVRETEWNVNNEYVHLGEKVEVPTQQSFEIDFGSILQTTFSTPPSKGSAGVSPKVLDEKSVETDFTSKEPTVQYVRGNDDCIHLEETVEVSTRQTSELGFEVVSETSEVKWEESPGENIAAIRKEICEQECKKERDVGVSDEIRETEWNANNEYVHLEENVEVPTQQSSEIDFGSILQTTFSTPVSKGVSPKVLEDKSVETDSTSKERTIQCIRGNDECVHFEETVELSRRETSELDFKGVTETSEVKWEESPGENIAAIRKEICEQECKKERDVGVSVEVRETEWNVNDEYVHLGENVDVSTQQSSEIDFGSILQTTFNTPLSKGSAGVSPKVLEDKSVETDSASKERTVQCIHGNDEYIHLEETIELSTQQTLKLDFKVVSEASEPKWEESPGENISALRKEICEQECQNECDVGVSVEVREMEPNVNDEYLHLGENVGVPTQQSSELDFGSILQTTFSTPVSKVCTGNEDDENTVAGIAETNGDTQGLIEGLHDYSTSLRRTFDTPVSRVCSSMKVVGEEYVGDMYSEMERQKDTKEAFVKVEGDCEQNTEDKLKMGLSTEIIKKMNAHTSLEEIVGKSNEQSVAGVFQRSLDDLCEFGSNLQRPFDTSEGSINRVKDEDKNAVLAKPNRDTEKSNEDLRGFGTTLKRTFGTPSPVSEGSEEEYKQNRKDEVNMEDVSVEALAQKLNQDASLEDIDRQHSAQTADMVSHRLSDADVSMDETGFNLRGPFDTPASEVSLNKVQRKDNVAAIAEMDADAKSSNDDLSDIGTSLRIAIVTPVSKVCSSTKVDPDDDMAAIEEMDSDTKMLTEDVSDLGTTLRRNFGTPVSRGSLNKVQNEVKNAATSETNTNTESLVEDLCDFGTTLQRTFDTPVSEDREHEHNQNIEQEIKMNVSVEAIAKKLNADASLEEISIQPSAQAATILTHRLSDADASMNEIGPSARGSFDTPASTERNSVTESLKDDLCDFGKSSRKTISTPLSKEMGGYTEKLNDGESDFSTSLQRTFDTSVSKVSSSIKVQTEDNVATIGEELSRQAPAMVPQSLSDDLCYFALSPRRIVGIPLSIGAVCGSNKVVVEDNMASTSDMHLDAQIEDLPNTCLSLGKTFGSPSSEVSSREPSEVYVAGIADENVGTQKPNKNVCDFGTTFQSFSDTPVSEEGEEYTARIADMNSDISDGENIEGDNLILNEAVMEGISGCDGSKFIRNADNNETPHFSETNSQSKADSEESIEAEEDNAENVAEFDEAEDDIDFVQHVPDELFEDIYFERDYDFVREVHNAKQESQSQEGIDRRSMSQVALEELAVIETSLPVEKVVEHNFNQEENALPFSFNDKDTMEISEFSNRFADPVVDGGDDHKLNDANEHENVSLLSSVAETDGDQEVGSPATSVTPFFTTDAEGGIDESKFDEATETEKASFLPVVDHSDNDRDSEARSPISFLNSVEEAEALTEMRGTAVMASAGGTDEIGSLLRKMHISSAAKMSRIRTSMTASTPQKSFDSVMKENMLNVKMEHSATPHPVDRSVKRRALEDLRKSGKREDKKLRFLNP